MAMNIISKEKKEIKWLGLPTNSAQECQHIEVWECVYYICMYNMVYMYICVLYMYYLFFCCQTHCNLKHGWIFTYTCTVYMYILYIYTCVTYNVYVVYEGVLLYKCLHDPYYMLILGRTGAG